MLRLVQGLACVNNKPTPRLEVLTGIPDAGLRPFGIQGFNATQTSLKTLIYALADLRRPIHDTLFTLELRMA